MNLAKRTVLAYCYLACLGIGGCVGGGPQATSDFQGAKSNYHSDTNDVRPTRSGFEITTPPECPPPAQERVYVLPPREVPK